MIWTQSVLHDAQHALHKPTSVNTRVYGELTVRGKSTCTGFNTGKPDMHVLRRARAPLLLVPLA